MYERSRLSELYPQGNMTEYDLLYLIAAIHYRMNNFEESKKYISKLMAYTELRRLAPKAYDSTKKLLESIREQEKEKEKNNKTAGRNVYKRR